MPIYSYHCNDPKCDQPDFDDVKPMSKAHIIPPCPSCGSIDVDRDWGSEGAYLAGPTKTVGSLMDKNSKRMSEDEKQKIIYDHGKEQNKGTGSISPWKRKS